MKCWPEFFASVKSGEKNFDLRKADRLYGVGDTLVLQEFTNKEDVPNCYTGEELIFQISYILWDEQFPNGLKKGYCILGLKEKPEFA